MKRKSKQELDQKKMLQAKICICATNNKSTGNKAQSDAQKINLETESKLKVKQAEIAFEIEKQKAEAQLKATLMEQEFQYNMQLRDVSENALAFREGSVKKRLRNKGLVSKTHNSLNLLTKGKTTCLPKTLNLMKTL